MRDEDSPTWLTDSEKLASDTTWDVADCKFAPTDDITALIKAEAAERALTVQNDQRNAPLLARHQRDAEHLLTKLADKYPLEAIRNTAARVMGTDVLPAIIGPSDPPTGD